MGATSLALLIADEPTTALDLLAAQGIIDSLRDIRRQQHLSLLLISHDLGLVGQLADVVAVVYAGHVVELGPTAELLRDPRHPYTTALLRAIPPRRGRQRRRRPSTTRLPAIAGSPPDPLALPAGCRFASRCAYSVAACGETQPDLAAYPTRDGASRYVRCSRLDEHGRLPAVSSRALQIVEDEAP
jgi:oligopeptide/dipeptide ABC transporter ATP-binding protein